MGTAGSRVSFQLVTWTTGSIKAEVKKEREEKKGETIVRSKRYYGKQYRGFSLQHDVDQSKAEAKYDNGVLQLTLPKKGGSAAKRLAVK
jgi:HSP20 family protein